MQNEPEVTKASVYRPPAQRNGNSGDYPRDSRDSDRRYDSRDNWNDRRGSGYDRDHRNGGYGGRDRGGGGFWSRDSDRRGSDYDRRGGYDRRRDYDDNYSRDHYSRSRDYDRRDYDRRPNDENPPQTDSRWRDLDSDRRDDRSNGHYRGSKGGSRDGRYYDGPRDGGHRDRYDDGPRDGGRDGPDGDRRGSDRRPESRNDTPEATEADETWSQLQPRDERLEKELFAGALSGINFDKYDDIPVSTSGENVPEPVENFLTCGLGPIITENVKLANYTVPTPVQKWAVPIIHAGRDIMSCAQTGSGKTAAFLMPMLSQIFHNPGKIVSNRSRKAYPLALVLSPTRELTMQIYQEARKFAYRSNLKPCVIYGGADVGEQIRNLQRGCHLLVATPGRLVDFLERGKVGLEFCRFLCLDEADRMLDMGFEPQIRRIIEQDSLPAKTERQTLMFSATFPKQIQTLASDFLNNYIFLTVGRVGSTSANITQRMEYVSEGDKVMRLLDLLDRGHSSEMLTIVFTETKRGADYLDNYLHDRGFSSTCIHGDRNQREREDAVRLFKSGQAPILVATAVAARGLDISNVRHVINFDLPSEVDEYVHRIGRTGRAGNTGWATSFFNESNMKIAPGLVDLLSEAKQDVPDKLKQIARAYHDNGGRRPPKENNRNANGFGSTDIREKAKNGDKAEPVSAGRKVTKVDDADDWWSD